jgi:CubicO group peptidase (beta-lactamase class C family)
MMPEVPTYPEASYRVCSVTKMVAATTVMKLVELGLLSLDTPVKNYVSELKLSNEESLNTITIRHLLSHVSGISGKGFEDGIRDESLIKAELLRTLEAIDIRSLPSENKFLYENYDFALAGLAASSVTGEDFSALARKYVLDPLRMTATTFDYQVASTYPFALPHEVGEDGVLRVVHYHNIDRVHDAAGGMYSTVGDLSRFARFILNRGLSDSGERVLSRELFDEMTDCNVNMHDTRGGYYGLGFTAFPYGDGVIIGHNGDIPPYNAACFADYKSGFGVAVCMNTYAPKFRNELVMRILDEVKG